VHRDAEDEAWVGEEVGDSCHCYLLQTDTSWQKHQVAFLDPFSEPRLVTQPLQGHALCTVLKQTRSHHKHAVKEP